MNKIYKVIWNTQLGCWQAVSELAKNHTSSQTTSTVKSSITGIVQRVSALLFFGMAMLPLSIHAAISNTELPTGAQINSGSATFNQTGNTLNINQNSQNLSTNWNTFNIGQDATVNFNQQNKSSVAINHVKDSNASQIMGRLNANGQVFLLNPNGVVFSKTAQVNVGGLVASTLSLNDADIQNGKFTLKGDANSTATIENQGTINTLQGGTVALIAPNVKNTGTIKTPNGTTHLTSASQVTLALQNGSLTQYQVDQGVLQGLVDNGGAIIADNGAVLLTAKAKDSLSKAVVNHTGIIEANRLTQNAKGEIILLGDMQSGETNVSGTLKAEGKNGADGGFIETSAAKVNIDKDIKVSTLSDSGKTGNWLIDPYNVVISNATGTGVGFVANQNDTVINAATLNTALASNNITVTTAGAGTQAGNINVNAGITWGANTALTLRADNDININANISANGTNGKLNLEYGQTTSNTNANYYLNNGATVNLKAGQNFSTKKGNDATKNYTVITSLGSAGSMTGTDLQGINGNLLGSYVLGSDIDASSTWEWNTYTGFDPIGYHNVNYPVSGSPSVPFRGTFDGLGHTIKSLTIGSGDSGIGLFAETSSAAVIRNVGLTGIDYLGYQRAGGLVAKNYGLIENSYVTGKIQSFESDFGGLVGWNDTNAKITNSFADVDITSKWGNSSRVGGLVGVNQGTIENSYATGDVIGTDTIGGLVGSNEQGTIKNSYSSGKVEWSGKGTQLSIGGLAGFSQGTIQNSYWNTTTSGRTNSAGGTGLTTAEMFDKNKFTGFDLGTVWGNGDNQTTPYLLNISANQQVYNKNDVSALYTVILNANQLQNMNQNLSGKYLLGNNIDASDTVNWNSGAGFNPVGNNSSTFTGVFDGLNNTVGGLYISRPNQTQVGLFGVTYQATIQNIGLVSGSVLGGYQTAPLVGLLRNSLVNNSYASTAVTGSKDTIGFVVGGLIGETSASNIKNSYATGSVKGATENDWSFAGGLVGALMSNSSIENSYTTGSVSGRGYVGGIVGWNLSSTIKNVYAIGAVSGINFIGGLAGNNDGTISNSFWNKETTTLSNGVGGGNTSGVTGITTAQMQNLSTFTDAGWDIDDVGGTGKVWRIYEGQTAPLLRSFLTTLDLNSINKITTYNGLNQTLATVNGLSDNLLVSSGIAGGRNAGDYLANYSSNQQGYDLIGNTATLTINKATLNINAVTDTRTYDGTDQSAGVVDITGVQTGDTVTAQQEFDSRNAGNRTLSVAGVVVNDGNNGDNYNVVAGTASGLINKATLNVNAVNDTRTYDGTNQSAGTVDITGVQTGDTVTAQQVFDSRNAGNRTLSVADVVVNDGNNGDNYNVVAGTASGLINKATLNVNAVTDTRTYDGTDQSAGVVDITGVQTGDTVTAQQVFDSRNAGNRTLSVAGVVVNDGNNGDNYNVVAGTASGLINKATLNVNAVTDTRTYDGTDQSAGVVDITGVQTGDTVTAQQVFDSRNAGNRTLSVAGVVVNDGNNGDNYNVVAGTASGLINKATLNLNAVTDTRTYDGTDQSAGVVDITGVQTGDTVTAQQEFDSRNAGNRTLSVTDVVVNDGNNGDNYDVVAGTASGVINKATLNLNAVTDTRTYDGTDQSAGVVDITGVQTGDTVTAQQEFDSRNAGNRTLSVTDVVVNDGNNGDNYDVVAGTASGVINKATLNLNAVTDTRTYDGTDQSAGVVDITGVQTGDTVTAQQEFDSRNAGNRTLSVTDVVVNDGNNGDNYNVVAGTASGLINKATLNVNAVNDTRTYDGTNQSAGVVDITGVQTGDTVTAQQEFDSRNAGNRTLSVAGVVVNDGNNGDNYNVVAGTASGVINKATLNLNAVTDTRTYDGTDQSAGVVDITGVQTGDTVTAQQEFDSRNAGNRTLSVADVVVNDGNNGDNYNVVAGTASGVINKAILNLNAVTDTRTYDGTDQSAGVVDITGVQTGDTVTAQQEFDSRNAGNRTLSVTDVVVNDGNNGDNYDVVAGTASGVINKATLNLNAVTDTRTYDGTDQSAGVVDITGVQTGDTVTAQQEFDSRNAGNRTLSVTDVVVNDGNNGDNYNVVAGTASGLINKATLNVNAVNDTRTYDGTNQSAGVVDITGVQTGDTVTAQQEFDSRNAGNRTLSVAGVVVNDGNNGDNYNVVAGTASGVINKATLNLNAVTDTRTYDGTDQSAGVVDITGVQTGDTVTAQQEFDSRNAGNRTLSVAGVVVNDGNNGDNYNVVAGTASGVINKATLNLNAVTDTRTYDGTDQSAGVVDITGVQTGDTVTAQQEFDSRNAGNRTLSVAGVVVNDGNNGDNYNVVAGTASGLINKAQATVTANGLNTVYNGKDQTATGFTASGLVNGETESVLTGVSASITAKDAGKYANTATGTDKNYDLTFVDGSLDIAKAQATITANSLNTTYNGKYQTATGFIASGLVNGETESVLTGVSASVTAKDVGKYVNTATGTDKNYDLTFVDGSLDIAKAQAIITANSLNTVYNGKDQTATGFTAKGLVNGETESVLSNVSASVTGKDAGTYSNTATGTDSNYDLSFVDGSLNITKAKINQVNGITANNRVYDATTNATLNTSSAQFDGIMLGDELVVGNATGKFSDKNAANGKQVSINNISLIGADAHNYDLVNDTAQTTANINKANISSISGITANNRTYNGLTDASLNLGNVQFNGIYQGDDLRIESSIGKFDTAATGQAKMVSITGLSLSGADAQNYNLVDTNAQTQANIYMLTPEAYLQAIQFKRPRYLPETSKTLNTVDLEVRQGGVNTAGIQILAGEH